MKNKIILLASIFFTPFLLKVIPFWKDLGWASCFAQFSQMAKIVASDRAISDNFGYSVSISGTYAIVGASQENEDASGGATMTAAGSAYIFERNGAGAWPQVQKIVASDRETFNFFGNSISISGVYAIVGAFGEDEDAAGGATMFAAGSAYIFERIAGVWTQANKIVPSDRAIADNFGYSVGISGAYPIVGAYTEDENAAGGATMSAAGSAYVFSTGVVLPVQLLYFNVYRENNNLVRCEWSTASEINNDYFAIEGSKDGTTFERIGMMQGAGNSSITLNYVFYDHEPYSGLSYYRLRQVDYNGQYKYSPIRQVYMVYKDTFELITIYPNPSSEYIHYTIASEERGMVTVKVMDVLGREVISTEEVIEGGVTTKKLNTISLANGSYLLQISTKTQKKVQKQFVVK